MVTEAHQLFKARVRSESAPVAELLDGEVRQIAVRQSWHSGHRQLRFVTNTLTLACSLDLTLGTLWCLLSRLLQHQLRVAEIILRMLPAQRKAENAARGRHNEREKMARRRSTQWPVTC
jgi:hypothetical protein